MRQKHKPQELQALAEPREARPSGAMRITFDVNTHGEDEQTVRSALPITRPNTPLPVLPSMLVDASYLQIVSSVRAQLNARRRKLSLVAVGAFVCGMLSVPLTMKLVRPDAPPATASRTPSAGATLVPQEVPEPVSAAKSPLPPQRTRMNQRDAAKYVRSARELRRAGRVQDARPLLTNVLSERPGHPAALAAMAELELASGRPAAAVRCARLAVRSLPWSVENWNLLSKACTAAGLHVESSRATARAAQLASVER